jgi:flavorubredoxin
MRETAYPAVKVAEHVYWVGAIDWATRDFHGYAIPRGTTYNAYLVLADKPTLIDTVKAPFFGEMLSRIASVIDPADIAYIVSNHAEPDHSGALPQAIQALNPEKVFASTLGVPALQDHYHLDYPLAPVKDGERVSLGNLTLTFLEARMLHWPDSMMTYLGEERVLLPNDAFGQHLASSARFADELPDWLLEYEAARYYANILLPLSPLVARLLEKVAKLALPIDTIAPSHGPIWRSRGADFQSASPQRIISSYAKWAAGEPRNKAVVVYDTMWQSTEHMARAIGEGLSAAGTEVKMMPLKSSHRSDVAAELLDAGALLVGSPTLNNAILPTVADALTYVRGLKPRHLIGAAFGSFGWSGEAVGQLEDILREMKVELVRDGLKVKYVPDQSALAECFALGSLVAARLRERALASEAPA